MCDIIISVRGKNDDFDTTSLLKKRRGILQIINMYMNTNPSIFFKIKFKQIYTIYFTLYSYNYT